MLLIYNHKAQGPSCLYMQQHPECLCHNQFTYFPQHAWYCTAVGGISRC